MLVRESYQNVGEAQIQEWVDTFNRNGCLFLREVLSPGLIEELRADLDRELVDPNSPRIHSKWDIDALLRLRVRMFEASRANLSLFNMEPIVSFAEALVAKNCHVIHNNSFLVKKGGGISGWHQDDALHFVVTQGQTPTNIRLPVLFFTCNYYLTDATELDHGPTEVVPGSHLFGSSPPPDLAGTPWESQVVSCLGKAGSVIMFNNQVWHRGRPNSSDRVRYITQITYGRRLIAHMYYPFMNYIMPEHVHANADPRLKRLLGFLPKGAYG